MHGATVNVSRKIFSVLFLTIFVTTLGLGIVAPLMPIFAESLGATGIWLGIIFSGFSLSRVVFMPIIGKLSDRKGRKLFITSGLLLYAILSLLYPLAKSVMVLVGVRLVHGFASAMVFPIAMAYVGEIAKEGTEGKTMGTFNLAMFLGMGAGPFLGGVVKDAFGFPAAFYSMSALTAVAFFISLFLLPDVMSVSKNRKRQSIKELLKSDTMKGVLIFRLVSSMGRASIMAFLPIIASGFHITTTQIGIILSSLIFFTALLQRPFGKLADRYNKVHQVLVGSIVATLPLFAIPFSEGFLSLFVIGAFIGVGSAIAMPSASAISVIIGQDIGMGATMGVFSSAMSVGMIIAPVLSGVVMDLVGLRWVFYVAGILSSVGIFLFYYFAKHDERFKAKL